MSRFTDWIVTIAAVALIGAGIGASLKGTPEPCPDGGCPQPAPAPAPTPAPPKKPRPKDWGKFEVPVGTPLSLRGQDWKANGVLPRRGQRGASVGGPVSPAGLEIHADLPGERHRKNTASKGLGLCVFTSIHHCADQLNIPQLLEMPKWMIDKGIAGGGYPSKVTTLIERLCKERNAPVPDYFQVESPASQALPILQAACESGRMVCITYSRSPTGRYGGRGISHMVNCSHYDGKWGAILDNNYVGETAYEWLTTEELTRACNGGDGRIWLVIFNAPPPPPPPHNGGPPPAPAPRPLPAPPGPRYEWKPWNGNPDCLSLYEDGVEVGFYSRRERTYYPRNGDGYGPAGSPPCETPDFQARPAWIERGVEPEKLSRQPRFRHGEYEVSYDDVLLALARVPEDGKKVRVTAIGPEAARAKLDADWKAAPELAAVKDDFVYTSYDPAHWHVARYGFKIDGKPTVYGQAADGKVLFRLDEYPGAAKLATALRRVRPDYDPSKDRPTPAPSSPGESIPYGALGIVGGIAGLAFALARFLTRKPPESA